VGFNRYTVSGDVGSSTWNAAVSAAQQGDGGAAAAAAVQESNNHPSTLDFISVLEKLEKG
jgi:hypothetical protein